MQDLNSQNGTKVNGSHVMRKRLNPGDTLSMARHKYKIQYSPEELGAIGPPPSEEEDITTVLGKIAARKSRPAATARYVERPAVRRVRRQRGTAQKEARAGLKPPT